MAAAFCAAAFALSPVFAAEPDTVVIGGPENQGPPVIVDLGAIDEAVGAPSGTPDQVKLHPAGKAAVHLHKAGSKPAKAAAAKSKDESKPTAAEAPPQVAPVQTASVTPAETKPAAPPAETPPAPAQTPPPPTPQVAALPSAPKPLTPPPQPEAAPQPEKPGQPSNNFRVLFVVESDQLQDPAPGDLDGLAAKLKTNDQRLQIIAYASGSADQSSAARRLSLKRALTVREFLIERGVRSTRMDVRALGNQSGEGPPDRVDIVLESH
jgi:outer membrane protein OmpA-like peptidoglycan-associated protein